MKTLLIMLLSVTFSLGVSAQRKGYYPVYHHLYRPRVYVAPFGYGLGYGYPYFGYPSYGYPYGYRQMPYKLELQIESIKNDYQDRIRQARKDKSLSHSQRRQEIRNLKNERDQDVINAKWNYGRPTNNMNPGLSNQNNNINPPANSF